MPRMSMKLGEPSSTIHAGIQLTTAMIFSAIHSSIGLLTPILQVARFTPSARARHHQLCSEPPLVLLCH
jgi:hypothetical protein